MFVLMVATYFLLAQPQSDAVEGDIFSSTKQKIINFSQSISKNISNFFSPASNCSTVKFLLYQKGSRTPVIITKSNVTGLIDLNLETFIIIHGWTDNGTLPWIVECAKRLGQIGKFNVLAVDWSVLASGDYFSAVASIKIVGDCISNFIKSVNLFVNKIQIIAHSLGAQAASFVAKALNPEKLQQIVGLDPAGPVFDWPVILLKSYRLTSDDAKCVQVIHTSIFFRGVTIPSGTIDFYVNKGANQPGCPSNNTISCSHQLAHTYFILTITNITKYSGTKWCSVGLFGCNPDTVYMGFGVNATNCSLGIFNVTAGATGIDPYTQF